MVQPSAAEPQPKRGHWQNLWVDRSLAGDSDVRFLRHGRAKEWSRKEPWRREPPGLGRFIHPPWSGYPLSGCSPAEPDSVSPDEDQYSLTARAVKSVVPEFRVEGSKHFPSLPRNNAMKLFLQRHAEVVTGVLSGFDRLVLRGSLRLFVYAKGF